MATPTGDVAHLLRRAGFGGDHAEVQRLAAYDIKDIVDEVLDVSDAPLVLKPAKVGLAGANGYEQWVAMTQWWLERMRTTPAPLVEKLALFWHGHLCTALDKVESPELMWNQLQLFRDKGLGSFRDLMQATAVDPAMLRYLDNDKNVVGAPNENFARELMELFTLGVNRYTQADVIAAARAWTGHGIDRTTSRYRYDAAKHDGGQKTFFGITKAWNGPEIIDEILLGKTREVAARHVVTKLWSFLAYPYPEVAVIDAVLPAYLGSNLNIKALVKAMFLRPEFYSAKAKQGLVRSPIEYMVATMRGLRLPATELHPEWWCTPMGQTPFVPPNVSGWRPNGYWISSASTWAKIAWANHARWKANETDFAAGIDDLPPAESVKTVLRELGVTNAGPATKAALRRYVERERATEPWVERPNLIFLALLCPEMQLA